MDLKFSLREHRVAVTAVCYLRGLLVTSDEAGKVRVWTGRRGTELALQQGSGSPLHGPEITQIGKVTESVQISKQGESIQIANETQKSTADDSKIRQINKYSKKISIEQATLALAVVAGLLILQSRNGRVTAYHIKSSEATMLHHKVFEPTLCSLASTNTHVIVPVHSGCIISRVSTSKFHQEYLFPGDDADGMCLALAATSKQIYLAYESGSLLTFPIDSPSNPVLLHLFSKPATSVSATQSLVAAGSIDGSLILIGVVTDSKKSIRVPGSGISSITIHPTNHTCVAGTYDGDLISIPFAHGSKNVLRSEHKGAIRCVSWVSYNTSNRASIESAEVGDSDMILPENNEEAKEFEWVCVAGSDDIRISVWF